MTPFQPLAIPLVTFVMLGNKHAAAQVEAPRHEVYDVVIFGGTAAGLAAAFAAVDADQRYKLLDI